MHSQMMSTGKRKKLKTKKKNNEKSYRISPLVIIKTNTENAPSNVFWRNSPVQTKVILFDS